MSWRAPLKAAVLLCTAGVLASSGGNSPPANTCAPFKAGTWSGLWHIAWDNGAGQHIVHDITVTLALSCSVTGKTAVDFTLPRAKVDDDAFACQLGCSPTGGSVRLLTPIMPNAATPGADILVDFPNGNQLSAPAIGFAGDMRVSSDGQTIQNSVASAHGICWEYDGFADWPTLPTDVNIDCAWVLHPSNVPSP